MLGSWGAAAAAAAAAAYPYASYPCGYP